MAVKYVPGEWLNLCGEQHETGFRHHRCPANPVGRWLKRRGWPTSVRGGAIKTNAPGDLVWEAQAIWEDRN